MYSYLRRKFIYNKNFNYVKNILKKIIGIFKLSFQFFGEIKDLIFYSGNTFEDKEFLGYSIRNHAHILEKHLKGLYKESDTSNEYGEFIFRKLNDELDRYKEKQYKELNTIKWAQKINKEYLLFKRSNFVCPLVGEKLKLNESNDFYSLLKNRRSIRHWLESEVKDDEIFKLIDAARWHHHLVIDNHYIL